MSSTYDLRPRTDGLGSVSGTPSVNTSSGVDEGVVLKLGFGPIFRYPYSALSISRW